jgi:hypothetical protein
VASHCRRQQEGRDAREEGESSGRGQGSSGRGSVRVRPGVVGFRWDVGLPVFGPVEEGRGVQARPWTGPRGWRGCKREGSA